LFMGEGAQNRALRLRSRNDDPEPNPRVRR
jgi:hypothetical protein